MYTYILFICCDRLRDYTRSESERSFDECQMKRARLKSLGLAYLSPQNKSLAQSFRFMRTKPTIIAFKTPSLETCDYEIDALQNTGKLWQKITYNTQYCVYIQFKIQYFIFVYR